ncbi:MAG: hypothetical protein QXJ64_00030 [Thermosphaera sp.]
MSELVQGFIVKRTKVSLKKAMHEDKRLSRKLVEIPMDKVKELLRRGAKLEGGLPATR